MNTTDWKLSYQTAAAAERGEWQPTPPEYAQLEWRDGVPYGTAFQDYYFSRDGGLAETEYVFLQGSQFVERCAGQVRHTIAEFGFGSGLNFLASMRAFSSDTDEARQLTYISFEKFPLTPEDLQKTQALFPELTTYAAALQQQYPPAIAGIHCLEFSQYRTRLLLVLGEIAEFLPLVAAHVDTWFLDGFAPSRNPEMWSEHVFDELHRLSAPDAVAVTFSAARKVGDALTRRGFVVERIPGFGRKREMIRARRAPEQPALTEPFRAKRVDTRTGTVAVVGAGLAGAALASTLARRGLKVVVCEAEVEPARHASGNPSGVLMPYLSVKPDFQSRFFIAGFLYTLQRLSQLPNKDELFSACGVLRIASSGRLAKLLESLADLQLPSDFATVLSAEEAIAHCGLAVSSPGLWHSTSGIVAPAKLTRTLLAAEGVEVRYASQVSALHLCDDGSWKIHFTNSQSELSVDAVFLANAFQATDLAHCAWLPLEAVKGQLAFLPPQKLLAALRAVICYDGYLLPALDGVHVLGASYEHNAIDTSTSAETRKALLQRLEVWLPSMKTEELEVASDRAAYRSMTPDRMPIIGALPRVETFFEAYCRENGGGFGAHYPRSSRYPGLWVSLGHGSRGLASAFLSAEILASMYLGEALPVEADLLRAVDPARFLVRAIKRGDFE